MIRKARQPASFQMWDAYLEVIPHNEHAAQPRELYAALWDILSSTGPYQHFSAYLDFSIQACKVFSKGIDVVRRLERRSVL